LRLVSAGMGDVCGFDYGGGTLFWYVTNHPGCLVDSTFYPPWDGKMSTRQKAVML